MALGNDRKGVALQRFPTKVIVRDDMKLYFGDDENVSIEYDEDGTDKAIIAGSVTPTGAWNPSGTWTPSTGAWTFTSVTGLTTPIPTTNIDTGWKVQELLVSAATMLDFGLSDLMTSGATALIPAGAVVWGYAASTTGKFRGGASTTAVLMVGPGGATTTQSDWGPATNASVSTITMIGGKAQAGLGIVTTASKIRATVRTSSDATAVKTANSGYTRIKVFYSELF